MGKIPNELRVTIAKNIRDCRMKKFPGRGGGKRCAEAFGVSPQQWSPWERGMRTPDELRLSQIAKFFGVTVEFLRRDHTVKPAEAPSALDYSKPYGYYNNYGAPSAPILQEPDAPPYGLPPLRREDRQESPDKMAELAALSARILGQVGAIVKGVSDKEYDIGNTITVLRTLSFYLGNKLNEAEKRQAAEGATTDLL